MNKFELSNIDILDLFKKLAHKKGIAFLHSGKNEKWSILTFSPKKIFQCKNSKNCFANLKKFLNKYKKNIKSGHRIFPFTGGIIGYFGYDLLYQLEKIKKTIVDDLSLPDMYFGFYENAILYNHKTKKCTVFYTKKSFLEKIKKIIKSPAEKESTKTETNKIAFNTSKNQYKQAFQKIMKYIRDGEIYQINLSHRLETKTNISPHELFIKLAKTNPAEESAYLDCGNFQIISASPERFLKLNKRKILTCPIKGTRPRYKNPKKDLEAKNELLKNEKEAAELNMITDLLRNDIGRVSKPGSVKVQKLRAIQKCPTVWHTYSEIIGELDKKYDAIDLVRACFPGGSITGCPKIRAMKIIDELEPLSRGIYTGSLGYINSNGDMDLNIIIRTIVYRKGIAYLQVGGGIVADSKLKNEYQETLDKAKALIESFKL